MGDKETREMEADYTDRVEELSQEIIKTITEKRATDGVAMDSLCQVIARVASCAGVGTDEVVLGVIAHSEDLAALDNERKHFDA